MPATTRRAVLSRSRFRLAAGRNRYLDSSRIPLVDTHPTLTAVADANGNIFNNQFSPDSYDINIRFLLTAVGQTSLYKHRTRSRIASL